MKNLPLYVAGGLLIVLAYLIYFHTPPFENSAEYLFWGKMHILLSTIPIIIYFSEHARKNTFPFIAFVALFQMIAFGLSIFFIRITGFQMNPVLNIDAMEKGFWGLLIFYLTYFILYKYFFRRLKPFAPIPRSLDPLYFSAMIGVVLFIYVLSKFGGFSELSHLGDFCLYVYLGVTISKLLKRKAEKN